MAKFPTKEAERLSKALRLVWITDERLSAEQTIATAREGIAGGVTAIHLRRHDLTAAEFYALATRLRKVATEGKAFLIVNDRVDVALAVKADGIHLGRHGLPLFVARSIVSGIALVGYSAHSESEIAQAAIQGADYCSLSPIFTPISKQSSGRDPLGLDGLRRAAARSVLPVVALGGISEENCADCLAAGAAGVETSGALSDADSARESAASFAKALGG